MTNDFQFLFVIAIGRSGSTLLNGILNSNQDVLIRGENRLFVNNIFNAYKNLSKSLEFEDNNTPVKPYYGVAQYDLNRWLSTQRIAVQDLLIGSEIRVPKILGYKEIRYINLSPNELADHINFLDLLFPGCKFICHLRDLYSISSSGWWQEFDKKTLILKFQEYELFILNFLNKYFSERHVVTRYEQILQDPVSTLNILSEFLHVSFDHNSVDQLMLELHSTKTPTNDFTSSFQFVDLFPTKNRTF